MNLKTTNPQVRETILQLDKDGKKNQAKIWRTLAKGLDKPRQRRAEVNLWKLNKFSKEGDTVLVPGKVLGFGELNHKVTVAALNFSKSAVQKIGNVKGRTLTIQELVNENPKGSKIIILR